MADNYQQIPLISWQKNKHTRIECAYDVTSHEYLFTPPLKGVMYLAYYCQLLAAGHSSFLCPMGITLSVARR